MLSVENLSAFYTAFSIATQVGKAEAKQHRNNLPPLPKSWAEMLRHPEKEKFLAASQKEFTTLQDRGTWYLVDTPKDGTRTIPLI